MPGLSNCKWASLGQLREAWCNIQCHGFLTTLWPFVKMRWQELGFGRVVGTWQGHIFETVSIGIYGWASQLDGGFQWWEASEGLGEGWLLSCLFFVLEAVTKRGWERVQEGWLEAIVRKERTIPWCLCLDGEVLKMIIPFYSFFFFFPLYFSVFGSISGKQIRGNLSLDFPYLGCVW